MERQYNAQRFRLHHGRRVGTIAVGAILYIQDGARPFGSDRPVICRNPWKVEAWIPRDGWRGRRAGGHLAQVRSLRDGRVQLVADWILMQASDAGLER